MRGHKPGTPKTGGRVKGTPNKIGADLRAIAQQYTDRAVAALVKALDDPDNYVAAAKILLAYSHGAPRAAVDVSVKPIYVISGEPLTAEQWAAKYADDGNGGGAIDEKPVAQPAKPRPGVGSAGRPAKRAR